MENKHERVVQVRAWSAAAGCHASTHKAGSDFGFACGGAVGKELGPRQFVQPKPVYSPHKRSAHGQSSPAPLSVLGGVGLLWVLPLCHWRNSWLWTNRDKNVRVVVTPLVLLPCLLLQQLLLLSWAAWLLTHNLHNAELAARG